VSIASTSAAAVSSASQSAAGDSVSTLVLKKALAAEASAALALIKALPPVPSLAAQGNVGTRLHVVA